MPPDKQGPIDDPYITSLDSKDEKDDTDHPMKVSPTLADRFFRRMHGSSKVSATEHLTPEDAAALAEQVQKEARRAVTSPGVNVSRQDRVDAGLPRSPGEILDGLQDLSWKQVTAIAALVGASVVGVVALARSSSHDADFDATHFSNDPPSTALTADPAPQQPAPQPQYPAQGMGQSWGGVPSMPKGNPLPSATLPPAPQPSVTATAMPSSGGFKGPDLNLPPAAPTSVSTTPTPQPSTTTTSKPAPPSGGFHGPKLDLEPVPAAPQPAASSTPKPATTTAPAPKVPFEGPHLDL